MYHSKKSSLYRKFIKSTFISFSEKKNLEDLPFIPVRLFKHLNLKSINDKDIFKILKSSGTSGSSFSKIFLDRENAKNQTNILTKIANNFIGNKRLNMLVIDSKKTINDKKNYSARTAAILGFSIFSKKLYFALNDDLTVNYKIVNSFFKSNKKFFIFGFTSIIWEKFILDLKKNKVQINLNDGILIHGGGWKKIQDKGISNKSFKSKLLELLGITKVINYYGMVEQTGSIFFECNQGFFHTSEYSDIIIRDNNLNKIANKKEGLIQLLSILPTSYPGNSILTEDLGEIIGEDDCKCGRKGKYFIVKGRIPQADLRGCSDVL